MIAYGQPSLAGLSDVIETTPTANDILQYNGTDWVNTSINVEVLGQLLTGLVPAIGVITASDTILTAFEKLATAFNSSNRTLTTNAPILNTDQRHSVTAGANNLTFTLPDPSTMQVGIENAIWVKTQGFTGTQIEPFGGSTIDINYNSTNLFPMLSINQTFGFYTDDNISFFTW